MATPVDDSYSVGGGQTLYAGMLAPATTRNVAGRNSTQTNLSSSGAVAIAGEPFTILDYGTSTIASANPLASDSGPLWIDGVSSGAGNGGQDAVLSYSGVTYTPHLGPLGSIIFDGGGHLDYFGNEVYAFDLSTKTWSALSIPWGATPETTLWKDGSNYFGDGVYGECWSDNTFTTTLQSQLVAAHSYGQRICVAPGVAGSGAKGAFISMMRSFISTTGSRGGHAVHKFDLDTKVWSRLSTNVFTDVKSPFDGGVAGTRPFAYDATRGKVYNFPVSAFLYVFDFATNAWSAISGITGTTSGSPLSTGQGFFQHIPSLDILLHQSGSSGAFRVMDAANIGVWKSPGATGTAPATTGACCWDSDTGCLWFYPTTPIGGQTLFKLTPPADPLNDPWAWSSHDFAGVLPYDGAMTGSGYVSRNNLVYVPILRSAFWVVNENQPPQQFILS